MWGPGARVPRPVPVRTLAELGPRFFLTPYCPAYYRSGERLDYARMVERHGPEVELEALRRRLRCRRCGYRDCHLYRGSDASWSRYGDGAE